VGERVRHGGDRAHGLLIGELRSVEPLAHHEARDQVGVVLVLLDAQAGVDVRMVELGRRARLAGRARGESLGAAEHLHRHLPGAGQVATRVDGAESAASQQAGQHVALGDRVAGQLEGGCDRCGLGHDQ
jgi:hypothetical protein